MRIVLAALLLCLCSCGNGGEISSEQTAVSTDTGAAATVTPMPSRESSDPTSGSAVPQTQTLPDQEGLLAGFSFDNRIGGRDSNLAETDLAYYGCPFGGAYLYYFDKESREGGFFCNKPECLHNNTKCGAFVGSLGTNSLCAWQGRLYFISTISEDARTPARYGLWSIAEDGSDRRLDMQLDPDEYGTQYKQLHQGNLFGIGYWDTVEEGIPNEKTVLYKQSLETGEKELLFVRENTSGASFHMEIWGDEVFILINLSGSDGKTINELYRCNWKTKETVQLLNDSESGRMIDEFAVLPDGEIFLTNWASTQPDGTNKAQLWQLKEGRLTGLPEFDLEEAFGWHLSSEIALALYPQKYEDGSYRGCVRDYAGNTVYEGKLKMPSDLVIKDVSKPIIMQLLWGDRDSLVCEVVLSQKGKNYYLVRFDISGETAAGEILWGLSY